MLRQVVPALLAVALAVGEPPFTTGPLADALRGPARHVRINGVEFSWRTFALPEAQAAALADLGAAWRAAGVTGAGASAGTGWQLATRRRGAWLETLQWRPAASGGIEGIWSSLDPAQPPAPVVAPPLRLPAGAAISATYEHLDDGAPVRQFIGSAAVPLRACIPAVRSAARRAGWLPEGPARPAGGAGVPEVSWYARQGERLRIHLGTRAAGCGFLLEHHLRTGEGLPPWP